MSWDCPYLKKEGSCELRVKKCRPLDQGCVIKAADQYKRLNPYKPARGSENTESGTDPR